MRDVREVALAAPVQRTSKLRCAAAQREKAAAPGKSPALTAGATLSQAAS